MFPPYMFRGTPFSGMSSPKSSPLGMPTPISSPVHQEPVSVMSTPINSSVPHQSRHQEPPQRKRNEKDFCKTKRIIDEPDPNNIIEAHISKLFKNTDNIHDFLGRLEDMHRRAISDLESTGDTIRNTFYMMERGNDKDKYSIMNKEIYGKLKDTDTDCKKNNKESYCSTNSNHSMNFYMEYILYLFLFISVIVILCQKQK